MSIKNEEAKKKTKIIVKNANSDEIEKIVHLHETKIGTETQSKGLEITGDCEIRGSLVGSKSSVPMIAGGRLTLTSGTPISSSNASAATRIYYTPYNGSQITLWNGKKWKLINFDEVSIVPTLGVDKNYDVFAYAENTTLILELGTAWSSSTARESTDDISFFQGTLCKTTNPTRRYLGTVRTTSSSLLEDSTGKRFVWNFYNRATRSLLYLETTDSWNYATTGWRPANNGSTPFFESVTGTIERIGVEVRTTMIGSSAGGICGVGVGIDSTTVNSAQIFGAVSSTTYTTCSATFSGYPTIGYHKFWWLEQAVTAGPTITYFGDVGAPTLFQAGMVGELMG